MLATIFFDEVAKIERGAWIGQEPRPLRHRPKSVGVIEQIEQDSQETAPREIVVSDDNRRAPIREKGGVDPLVTAGEGSGYQDSRRADSG